MSKRASGRRLTEVLRRANRWWWSGLVMVFVFTAGAYQVERMIGQAMAFPFLDSARRSDGRSSAAPTRVERADVRAVPNVSTISEPSNTGDVQPLQSVSNPPAESPRLRSTRRSNETNADRSTRLEPADDWTTSY